MTYIPKGSAQIRDMGDTVIENLVTKDHSPLISLAVASVNGVHPLSRSSRCVRIYYVLEGTGDVQVGADTYQVEAGDAVLIPQGEEHGIVGNLRYIVVNTPAFDPSLE